MTRLLPLVLSLILSWPLGGQSREIHGRILDSKDRSPVAFANVFFKANQNRGVISNERGQFRIKLGLEDDRDTLVITELGYESVYLAISDMNTDTLQVLMEEDALPLPEVTVFSDEHLRSIVREALRRLPEQYGSAKTWLRAYYREYSITDSVYSEMMEAFVYIEDQEFTYPPKDSKIRLLEFRRSLDRRDVPEEHTRNYTNGIYNIFGRFPYVLSRIYNLFKREKDDFLDHYRFFNNGEFLEGKDTLLTIGFIFAHDPTAGKSDAISPYRVSEMTIRKSDFGIVRLRQGNQQDASYNEISYRKVNGKYYPNRIQLVYSFSFDQGLRNYLNARSLHVLNVIPAEDRNSLKGNKGRFLLTKYGLRDIRYSYNQGFWEENKMLVTIPAPAALQDDLAKRGKLQDQFLQTARGKVKSNQ